MEDVQINAATSSSDSPPEIPDPQFVSDTTEKSKLGDTPMDERDDSMVCDPNSRLVLTGFTKANHSGPNLPISIRVSGSSLISLCIE